MKKRLKNVVATAAASLIAILIVAPVVRAGITDLATFTSAVGAMKALDPTLASPPNDGAYDSVVGSFRGPDGVNKIAFSAYSDADGANPHGYFTQTIAADKPYARERSEFIVTCLAVSGGHAALGITPADASTASPPTVVVMFDGGRGGADTYTYRPTTTAENCSQYLFDAYISPDSGKITVHDEP